MRISRLLLTASALTATFLVLASARPAPSAGRAPQATGTDEADLGHLMGKMRRQFKAASESAREASKNDVALAAVMELETLILEAKKLEPTNLTEIPTDARADHIRDYRHTMARLLSEVALAESELWHNENEAAARRLSGQVKSIRDEGHDAFQPADEH